jgi:zinc transport system substrate-binding protein
MRIATFALATAVLAAASGCAAADLDAPGETDPPAKTLDVLASFYPLEFLAERIGGDRVSVTSLTPPGADPHNVELSPRQVRAIADADLVLVLSGFQPAVDEAVAARQPAHLMDVALNPAVAERTSARVETDDHGEDDGHDDDGEEDGHDHEGDPHFWLDPTLLAAVAPDLAEALAEADPGHAQEYRARSVELADELLDLDQHLADGLANCQSRVVVTSHEAFGFLGARYDLDLVGISGIDPETEPSPARLRQIRDVVTANDVSTIFTEVQISPRVAETLASDLGIDTGVLDPLESRPEVGGYLEVMETNLNALRAALRCT